MVKEKVWTTVSIIAWTRDYLLAKGVENARLEAEWLLCAATGLDRIGLYLQYDKPLNDVELAAYRSLVSRRAKREPLQHILGTQEFSGHDYEVTPDVLIPRHDTEVLVTEAVLRQPGARTVLDVGTGSGCIAVTLKQRLQNAVVTATDISREALVIAERNATRHSVTIELLEGSLFTPVAGQRFDLIVSNPPYIPAGDIKGLAPEVRDYDPRIALDGGSDGLDIYRQLIPAAAGHLTSGGWLLVEVGIHQAAAVAELFQMVDSYEVPISVIDSGGIERVVGAQRRQL